MTSKRMRPKVRAVRPTNLAFHQRLMAHPAFIAGDYDTGFLGRAHTTLLGESKPELTRVAMIATTTATTTCNPLVSNHFPTSLSQKPCLVSDAAVVHSVVAIAADFPPSPGNQTWGRAHRRNRCAPWQVFALLTSTDSTTTALYVLRPRRTP